MILRVARHTKRINEITAFYTEVIGLHLMGKFENHDGYDGIFLGKENLNWHLEFTATNDDPSHLFDKDDLLVFYPGTEEEYERIIDAIEVMRIEIQTARNPYWNLNGVLITDPDGFGIMIRN